VEFGAMRITLTVVEGPHKGREFVFERHDTFIVGRSRHAQFRLPTNDPYFSRNHFLIEVNPPLCCIVDLKSRNGTFVNGRRINQVDLHEGDMIRGGHTSFRIAFSDYLTASHLSCQPDPVRPLETQSPVSKDHSESESGCNQAATVPVENQSIDFPWSSSAELQLTDSSRPAPAPARLPVATPLKQAGTTSALKQFPGFQTVRIVGKGGMGVVYEAISIEDRKRVAIKTLIPKIEVTERDLQLFQREADILKDLVHPNIVRFRSIHHADGEIYMVMDFVDGPTADQLLASLNAPLSPTRAVGLAIQLLEALRYAHELGYVHRDVKPSNLLITKTPLGEKLWLSDFGLARMYQSSKLSGLTMLGEIGGTTPFLPPEQITNYRSVGPASDQYSAAAVLYFLLTRHHAYDMPREVPSQILMLLQDDPIPIHQRRQDLPPPLVEAIHRALARNPTDRFKNVAQFQRALTHALS
jgi:eukaryotic-like serine/threonine-protein kinase